MNSDRAFYLVIGMVVLTMIEGFVKAAVPAFPFVEVAAAQDGLVAYILTTKTVNDVAEMRNGIAATKLAAKQAQPCPPTP